MSASAHSRWIVPLVIVAIVVGVWWVRRRPPQYSYAYIGDRAAVMWSTTAQVRQQVSTLHYGERVAILLRSGDQLQVRSDNSAQGWVDARLLIDPALWQQIADLTRQVRTMPVQAVGHTRARSNVRIGPGRDAPIVFQFGPNEQLVIFSRKAITVSRPGESAPGKSDKPDESDKQESKPDPKPDTAPDRKDSAPPEASPVKDKSEDWLLVLRSSTANASAPSTPAAAGGAAAGASASPDESRTASGPIAGWVLAQFVVLDPPGPIADYTTAAGMRAVAWAVLNTVPDPKGEKPQYLVAASRGGQDRACDFTGLRVYTWDGPRQRYETAYVENNLCGQMPIRVKPAPNGAEFQFPEVDENGAQRIYRLNQTAVRRMRDNAPAPKKRR